MLRLPAPLCLWPCRYAADVDFSNLQTVGIGQVAPGSGRGSGLELNGVNPAWSSRQNQPPVYRFDELRTAYRIYFSSVDGEVALSMPQLTGTARGFYVTSSAFTSISAPELLAVAPTHIGSTSSNDRLEVSNNHKVTVVDFPKLLTIGAELRVGTLARPWARHAARHRRGCRRRAAAAPPDGLPTACSRRCIPTRCWRA